MELKLKDVCGMLQVSEKTIYRWINDNKIPAYKINHQYRFKKLEIEEWILKNKIFLSKKEQQLTEIPVSLCELLGKGGVFHQVDGKTVFEVFTNSISQFKLPKEVNPENLITSLMQREEMSPTAISRGIAIPHPRNPVISNLEEERLFICFLKYPVDFKSIDAQPVKTLFFLLSSSPKRHVESLSKISYLCQQNDFLEILFETSSQEQLFSYFKKKDSEWQERHQH